MRLFKYSFLTVTFITNVFASTTTIDFSNILNIHPTKFNNYLSLQVKINGSTVFCVRNVENDSYINTFTCKVIQRSSPTESWSFQWSKYENPPFYDKVINSNLKILSTDSPQLTLDFTHDAISYEKERATPMRSFTPEFKCGSIDGRYKVQHGPTVTFNIRIRPSIVFPLL